MGMHPAKQELEAEGVIGIGCDIYCPLARFAGVLIAKPRINVCICMYRSVLMSCVTDRATRLSRCIHPLAYASCTCCASSSASQLMHPDRAPCHVLSVCLLARFNADDQSHILHKTRRLVCANAYPSLGHSLVSNHSLLGFDLLSRRQPNSRATHLELAFSSHVHFQHDDSKEVRILSRLSLSCSGWWSACQSSSSF